MSTVLMPVAAWDVDPVIKYEKKLEGLSEYQQREVAQFRLNHGMSHPCKLVQCDRPGRPTVFEMVDHHRTLPFEFSICNLCGTALCEHKEGRPDWGMLPAR